MPRRADNSLADHKLGGKKIPSARQLVRDARENIQDRKVIFRSGSPPELRLSPVDR